MRSLKAIGGLTGLALLSALFLVSSPEGQAGGIQLQKDQINRNQEGTGKLPVCDAGDNQVVECTGPITMVQVDGSGSTDPLGGTLEYLWELCPNSRVTFATPGDQTSAVANLLVDMTRTCQVDCTLTLVVRNAVGQSVCFTDISVRDTTPPEITCPPDIVVMAGGPTDPGSTGMATATDACNPNPTISFMDDTSSPNRIVRTWTADDGCQTSTCDQNITIEEPPPGDPDLDIKPGSCPNPIQVNSNGVVPAALVGAAGFDVADVDTSSLWLSRVDGVGSAIAPIRIRVADVATPFDGEGCECHTLTGDGTLDLSLKFFKSQMVSAFQLGSLPHKTFVEVKLTGQTMSGDSFDVRDCIRVNNN